MIIETARFHKYLSERYVMSPLWRYTSFHKKMLHVTSIFNLFLKTSKNRVHSLILFYFSNLVWTPKLVHLPVHVILTWRQIERLHPLVGVLPALSGYFGDFHWSTKVHLEPLEMIVVPCAPGPHVFTTFDLTQSPKSGGVELIPFRRCCNAAVGEATVL